MDLRGRSLLRFALIPPLVALLLPNPPTRGQESWSSGGPPPIASAPVVRCRPAEPPPLGTFEPTPYVMVRGSWPAAGGYSPLQVFGDQSMSLYGPLSPFRPASAPVTTYVRGYDGRVYANRGTSSSTPNLPSLSPVVYPTPANYYYGPRVNRTPPSWSSGMNWIDQN
ncbi:MAG: hypothetical protein U0790_11570 [Isosphaeraceae bacterium]